MSETVTDTTEAVELKLEETNKAVIKKGEKAKYAIKID